MNNTIDIVILVAVIVFGLVATAALVAVFKLLKGKNKNNAFDVTPADVMESSAEVTKTESEKTRESIKNYLQAFNETLFAGVQATNTQVLNSVKEQSEQTYRRTEAIKAEVKLGLDETKTAVREELKALREELSKNLEDGRNAYASGIKEVREEVKKSLEEDRLALAGGIKEVREEVGKSLAETRTGLAEGLKTVREDVGKSLEDMKTGLAMGLKEVREENTTKLNEIRGVVDEKLTVTLNTRLKESFEQVSKQLESVNKGLGEMQSITTGMSDLRKVLGGIKNRGSWGEVALDDLLSDILAPGQYKKQFAVGQATNDNRKVDFAIVLPGIRDNEEVYLPVDSKFPLEDFSAMQAAAENGDSVAYANSKNMLKQTIRSFASSIATKYIQVPKTTDFAIMYLPIESLYAEVLRMDGLQEELQNKYRVIPAGPTNFTALLNSLRMGFKTVQIQKNSNELVKLLQMFSKDFSKFVDNLSTAQRQVSSVQTTLQNATERSLLIQDKLKKVEKLGLEQAEE